jgi:hypothetical protein
MPAAANRAWWQSPWLWLGLALASMLPFLVTSMPVMSNHFTHTARYHVMNHGAQSAYLPRYFAFDWIVIANMGLDLVMVPLGRLLPTERAANLAVALVPPLTVWGIYALARAAHGQVPATALLALPSVYCFTYLFGFENYHLSVALALLCAAAWIRLADGGALRRWLLMAPFSALVWLSHFAGWGAMGLIVLGWELSRLRAGPRVPQLAGIIGRMLPLAVPMLLYPLWQAGGQGQGAAQGRSATQFGTPVQKLLELPTHFKGEIFWVDVLLIAATALVSLWMLWRLWRQRHAGMAIACALLLLAWAALPRLLMTSGYADQRVLAVAILLFALALPEATPRQGRVLALIGLALFGLRLAEIGAGWRVRGPAMEQELAALAKVPMGARIAVFAPYSDGGLATPLHGLDHLANLAIVRREAFVNTQWDFPTGQLLRPMYNRGRGYNDITSVHISSGRAGDGAATLDARVDGLPRDRFDFVWVFRQDISRPWLDLVYRGPEGRLYRVMPTPSGG